MRGVRLGKTTKAGEECYGAHPPGSLTVQNPSQNHAKTGAGIWERGRQKVRQEGVKAGKDRT